MATNFTNAQTQDIVDQLNKEEVIRLIPMFIFLSLIAVIGIPGNGLVCYIYWFKYNMSSSRWFIFFLALVDIIVCGINVPSEITTSLHQYNFTNSAVCKLTICFNLWVLVTLGFIVLVLSVDRYRKVCKPLGWQINVKKAKILSAATTVLGFLLSIPIWWIYGINQYELTEYGVNASVCSFNQSSTKSYFAFYYLMFAMGVFISCLSTISILYCFIGKNIKRHLHKEKIRRHAHVNAVSASSHVIYSANNDDVLRVPKNESKKVEVKSEQKLTSQSDYSSFANATDEQISITAVGTYIYSSEMTGPQMKPKIKKKTRHIRRARARKATISLFLVSLVFVLSYLPLLVLLLIRSVVAGFEAGLTDAERATYKFFLRLCFLNCAINPFIYGLSDSKFRGHCKDVFRKLRVSFACKC